MRDRLPILAFAAALLFAAVTLLLMRAGARGEFAEASSTYRSDPDGARALFLFAQEAGLPVSRRDLDLETIEGTPELVLLGVEGTEEAKPGLQNLGIREDRLSEYEIDAILAAVERGANVVYAVNRNEPLLAKLGFELVAAKDDKPHRLVPFSPGPLTRGVSSFDVRISGSLQPATAPSHADGGVETMPSKALALEALPVLVDAQNDDQVVALVAKHGKGRVLVLSAPALASNAELGRGDTAQFWLDVLNGLLPGGGSGIEFDEYHHGFTGERSVMGYASRYGVPWAIAQMIFALGLWLFATRRLGEARPVEDVGPRAGTGALWAMARIYQLGGHRRHAAQALVRGLTRALQGLAGTHEPASAEEIAAMLDARSHRALAAELRALDAQARNPDLDEAGLLDLSRRCAAIRAHLMSSGKEAA